MSPERPLLGTMSATSAFLQRRLAGAQAAHDLHPAAGAHAARHRDRRQHHALLGVAVGPDVRSGAPSRHRRSVNQCGGSSVPRENCVRIDVEGAGGAAHRHQPDIVLDGAHAADPGPQILHRLVHPAHRVILRGAGKSHASAAKKKGRFRRPFPRIGGAQPVAHRQQRLEALPAPVDAVIDDQAVLDVHRFEQVDLRAAMGVSRGYSQVSSRPLEKKRPLR